MSTASERTNLGLGGQRQQRTITTEEAGNIVTRLVDTVTRKEVLDLLERQEYRCAITGWALTPQTASIDHVVPLSAGGDHCIANAQIVELRINQMKGTLTMREFLDICKAVVANASNLRGL